MKVKEDRALVGGVVPRHCTAVDTAVLFNHSTDGPRTLHQKTGRLHSAPDCCACSPLGSPTNHMCTH